MPNTTKNAYLVTDAELDINIMFSIIVAAVAIPSNFILILLFLKFKELRDTNNYAITMLSTADFLRSSIVMTTKIHNQIKRVTKLHFFMCHLTAFICAFSFVFSPLMLALISFVRYCKIVPQKRKCCHLTERLFFTISAILLFVATMFSILPYLGVGRYGYSHPHGVCFADWEDINEAFRIIFYTLVIGVAFPVLTVSYTMLYVGLRRNKMNIEKVRAQSTISNPGNLSSEDSLGYALDEIATNKTKIEEKVRHSSSDNPEDARGKKHSKESIVAVVCKTESPMQTPPTTPSQTSRIKPFGLSTPRPKRRTFVKNKKQQDNRVTKLLILFFLAYIFCWLPATVVNVISLTHLHKVPEFWFYIVTTLVDLKSALDPVIYGLGNKKYRGAFKYGLKRFRTWSSTSN